MTRKERDHERYMRQRDERLEKQRRYYREHRKEILQKKHDKGFEQVIIH